MKRYKKPLLFGCLFFIGIFLIYFFGLNTYVTFDQIKSHSDSLKKFVADEYLTAVIAYIILYALFILIALPIAIPLTLLGGYLFGVILGALYATIGATLGSIATFLLVRYWIKEFIAQKYKTRLTAFSDQMALYGPSYLVILHYLSIVPLFVINSLAAVAGMPFHTFLVTCVVGSFPVFLIYAFAGQQLHTIESAKDIFSPGVIIALGLLIGLACIPIIIKKKKRSIGL